MIPDLSQLLEPTLLLGFVPVLLFLAGLLFMDSYKLVHRHEVFLSLCGGALAAILSLLVNVALVNWAGLDPGVLRAFLFRLYAPAGGWPGSADARGGLMIPLSADDPGVAACSEPGLLLAHSRDALDQMLALQRASAGATSDRLH